MPKKTSKAKPVKSPAHKRISNVKRKKKPEKRQTSYLTDRQSLTALPWRQVTDYLSVSLIAGMIFSVMLNGAVRHNPGRIARGEMRSSFENQPLDLALSETDGLVANARAAPEGRFSYPVVLNSQRGHCGASLIAPDVILTAARCVTEFPGSACNDLGEAFVEIGTASRHFSEKEAEKIKIQECVVHPQYRMSEDSFVEYDFALLKLDKSSKRPPVWLDNGRASLHSNQKFTVMGWSRTSSISFSSSVQLMVASMNYVSPAKCADIYDDRISEAHLCSWSGKSGSRSQVPGDTGGPLVVKSWGNADAQDVQVGILSIGPFRSNGLKPNLPRIYSRVGHVHQWIGANANGVKFASVRDVKPARSLKSPAVLLAGLCVIVSAFGLI